MEWGHGWLVKLTMKSSMYGEQESDRFIVLLKESNKIGDNKLNVETLEGRQRQKGIATDA
jgi:hypothetical protein